MQPIFVHISLRALRWFFNIFLLKYIFVPSVFLTSCIQRGKHKPTENFMVWEASMIIYDVFFAFFWLASFLQASIC